MIVVLDLHVQTMLDLILVSILMNVQMELMIV